ncbi:hypothetical protein TTHERM_000941379 (macronuclear) [Tetrahymena thermophila SB210]|uniref:Kinase domain protein n=1 Tax=Tetrahymena thermophila (strain SB210) TaxID=312017 RepID=W7XEB4_TETTS|nr:hypothetical protein TTHERM_000941379 [Tetrahymena thermophila SB210]EWS71224.1 hypothetical protein TTHERM_000941379 [Tetrahymena thermophila SB210]|eukprot:XP_012656245.1 hypothetical protein TTHERM_000941379 [Tetrahymena thermophila SB210]
MNKIILKIPRQELKQAIDSEVNQQLLNQQQQQQVTKFNIYLNQKDSTSKKSDNSSARQKEGEVELDGNILESSNSDSKCNYTNLKNEEEQQQEVDEEQEQELEEEEWEEQVKQEKNNQYNQLLVNQQQQYVRKCRVNVFKSATSEKSYEESDEQEEEQEEEVIDITLESYESDKEESQYLQFEEEIRLSEIENPKSEEKCDEIKSQNSDLGINKGCKSQKITITQRVNNRYKLIQFLFLKYQWQSIKFNLPVLFISELIFQKNQQNNNQNCFNQGPYFRQIFFLIGYLKRGDHFYLICQKISQYSNLEELSLPFNILDHKEFHKIAKVLIKLNQLSLLNFSYQEDTVYILDKVCQQLLGLLNYCQKHIKFRLGLSFWCFPNFNMKSCSQLRVLQNLNLLNIDVMDKIFNKKDSFDFDLKELLSKCVNLQKLHLNLIDHQASPSILGQGLEKCEQLISLRVQFASLEYWPRPISGVDQFFNSLTNCRNLKNLHLEFSISQIDLQDLIKGLQKQQQLVTFRLFICQEICTDLVQSLAKLKRLVCFNYDNEQEPIKETYNDTQVFGYYLKQKI